MISNNIYNTSMTFYSPLKNHSIIIEYDLLRQEILINTLNIALHSPSELAIMLKNVVLEMKKKDILFVIQQVTKSDWLTILDPLKIFTFVNENTEFNFITIKCSIDRFPEATMKGLGFTDINDSVNL